jgi:hypothetical protein
MTRKVSKTKSQRPQEKDAESRPNDPPDQGVKSERTNALGERSKENDRPLVPPQAVTIPLSISSDGSASRSDGAKQGSDRPANWSVLGRKAVEVMEGMYLNGGYSIGEIAHFFKDISKSTVHAHLKHLLDDQEARTHHEARRQQYQHDADASGVGQPPNGTAPDPPPSSLSQPVIPSASPPQIVDVETGHAENGTDVGVQTDQELQGIPRGYSRPTTRPPLPVTDSETINELLMLFGRDMRRRGYTNFVDYFERHVIPMFERAEFWMENIPGNSPEEKDQTFRRYLWIVEKFLRAQKEYGEYESMNKGVKPQES